MRTMLRSKVTLLFVMGRSGQHPRKVSVTVCSAADRSVGLVISAIRAAVAAVYL